MLINEEEPGQTVNNLSRLSGSIDEDICVWKDAVLVDGFQLTIFLHRLTAVIWRIIQPKNCFPYCWCWL